MGSIEVVSIVIVIVFGALMLPILFDENPAAFLENSICIIITPSTDFFCDTPGGNVTFTGLNGIDIFVDPFISNSTIFWNFTGTTFGNITDVSITDPENSNMIHYNGSTNTWHNINATVWLTDSFDCVDGEFLLYNGTSGEWECITGQEFSATSSIDNDEAFFPHLSATNGDDVIVTFTDYNARSIKARDNRETLATWKYVIPNNYDSSQNPDFSFKLYWFTQTASAGDVQWDLSVRKVLEGEDLDISFLLGDTVVVANAGIDILSVDTFTVPFSTHNFTAGDLAYIQLERDARNSGGNPADTLDNDAYILLGELRWST